MWEEGLIFLSRQPTDEEADKKGISLKALKSVFNKKCRKLAKRNALRFWILGFGFWICIRKVKKG
jgi:hypothetical protein